VALVHAQTLEIGANGGVRIPPISSREAYNLCDSERFGDQPAFALCSGVLVSESLVLTAGHCARLLGCEEQAWMFGYAMTAPGALPELGEADVYRCASVVLAVREVDAAGRRWDFGVIELDRSVAAPRHAAPIGLDLPEVGDRVGVIGYPAGVPVKVDDARVLATRPDALDYFSLNSDTFDRSSGSSVVNARGELIGLLARGAYDYEYRDDEECWVSRRLAEYPDPATAEQASYVASALAADWTARSRNDRIGSTGCALATRTPGRFRSWYVLLMFALFVAAVSRTRSKPVADV